MIRRSEVGIGSHSNLEDEGTRLVPGHDGGVEARVEELSELLARRRLVPVDRGQEEIAGALALGLLRLLLHHHRLRRPCAHRLGERRPQIRDHRGDARITPRRILLQTSPQQFSSLCCHAIQLRFLRQYLGQRVGHILALEQPFACQQLVQHYAESPDVRALIYTFALGLLRRHISRGPQNHANFGPANRQGGRLLGIRGWLSLLSESLR